MPPYREPPPVAVVAASPSTSFPRKNVGLFTALVVALAGAALVLPTALLLGHAHGAAVFREGGAGMLLLAALSLPIAAAIGVGGALAVRGRVGWAAAALAAPILPAVIGALLGILALRRGLAAVAGLDGAGELRLRILSVALAESDSLPAYGAFIAAVACGGAACALLASAASVDRTQHRAPAGNAWAGPAVTGAATADRPARLEVLDPVDGVARPVAVAATADPAARVPVLVPGSGSGERLVIGLEPRERSASGNDITLVRSWRLE